MASSSTETGKSSDLNNQPKDLAPSPQPKKRGSKMSGARYVRFKTSDSSNIEGLIFEKSASLKISPKDLKFNKCYFVKDAGKVGRLWVNREVRGHDDLPKELQTFEQIEAIEDDP